VAGTTIAQGGKMTIRESMLRLLGDGMAHTREELHALCGPSNMEVINDHISDLRKLLRPKGEDIICVLYKRKIAYRWVRLIGSANNGRN
jgi:hypothetical protein